MPFGLEGALEEGQRACHEAIVDLGHETADLRRRSAAGDQPPNDPDEAGRRRGKAVQRLLSFDGARERQRMGALGQDHVVARHDGDEPPALDHAQVVDAPTGHLEQRLEGRSVVRHGHERGGHDLGDGQLRRGTREPPRGCADRGP